MSLLQFLATSSHWKMLGRKKKNNSNSKNRGESQMHEVFLGGFYLKNIFDLVLPPSKAIKRLSSVLFHIAFQSTFSIYIFDSFQVHIILNHHSFTFFLLFMEGQFLQLVLTIYPMICKAICWFVIMTVICQMLMHVTSFRRFILVL